MATNNGLNTFITSFINDATMATASATSGATSSSIKSYVDNNISSSGTWTPAITFQTPGNLSVSYPFRSAGYLKIGRLVILTCQMTFVPTYTTASGYLLLTGLPFTPTSIGGNSALTGINSNGSSFVPPANFLLNELNFNAAPLGAWVIYLLTTGSSNFCTTTQYPSGSTQQLLFTAYYFA